VREVISSSKFLAGESKALFPAIQPCWPVADIVASNEDIFQLYYWLRITFLLLLSCLGEVSKHDKRRRRVITYT
jgi:hypothetical protein